jgi:tetratricopeptide (TPR) repeat protein
MKNIFASMCLSLLLLGCNKQGDKDVVFTTNPKDYTSFLQADPIKSYAAALEEKEFWSKRLGSDSTGVGDLGPLAGAYSKLFETSGDIQYLKDAEQVYKKAITVAAIKIQDGYKRALAKNYITQHRFKDAITLLEESYAGISNKHATELLLFDCYLEVGAYSKALQFLKKIENINQFDYLIRISKWSDHQGDLSAAIGYMKKALAIANSRNNLALQIWANTNIADYYGHQGDIKASYNHYLKTLALQPDHAYAKKGIAWILYSKEYNTAQALVFIDHLLANQNLPDYYLLKAEMASYQGDSVLSEEYMQQFFTLANNPLYGDMYNTHKIRALVKTDPYIALQLAQKEVDNRTTPQSYQLLALAQLASNQKQEALATITSFVAGKTSEPMALLHSAQVYKANGVLDKVTALKTTLLPASYELGPEVYRQVTAL